MNETPDTDAAECDACELYGDDSSGPSGYVPIEVARKLERERDEARREAEAAWDCKWPKPQFSWKPSAYGVSPSLPAGDHLTK
jgi:hypothetical protein